MTQVHSASFVSALDTPALARHRLEGWLPPSLPESQRGTLRLLVSELVTNSVRHAAADAQLVALAVSIAPQTIRVEVHDGGGGFEPGTPVPRGPDAGFGGYGLFLVERMASRWGVETDHGTQVWFELDLAPAER